MGTQHKHNGVSIRVITYPDNSKQKCYIINNSLCQKNQKKAQKERKFPIKEREEAKAQKERKFPIKDRKKTEEV